MAWKLFYDGGCNLCHASKLRVETWAERAGQPLEAIPLQSDEGQERGYPMDAMVLEAEDQTLVGADAWLKLISIGPWYVRWLYPLRKIYGVRAALAWGYNLVAKYRLKWFGSRPCHIHGPR